MTDINALTSFSYQLLILLTVIVSKAVVSHFIPHEPLRFFQFYCLQLSNKVNKQGNSSKQQTIAGFVAIIVTLLPIAIILWLFEAFVEVDFLWQALLLYVALGAFGVAQANKSIAQALVANQNYLAKQTLNPWVLRETETLSSLGLSKASIEMYLLRTLQQGFTVAVIYIFFGPLLAICYRLLLEMHYCWNCKLLKFNHFGRCAALLSNIFQWLPVRLFTLLLLFISIGKNFTLFWRLSKPLFFQLNNNIALLLLALNLEVKLGGVALYDDNDNPKQKRYKTSFNDLARQPQTTDIIHAQHKVNLVLYLYAFFSIVLAVIIETMVS